MTITEAHPAPVGKMEFLSFQLGGLDYGVEFRKVKELRTLKSLERFASDGAILKGVAASCGVIKPPTGMDPEITVRPPVPNPGTTPVIRPPGSPGGNPTLDPK